MNSTVQSIFQSLLAAIGGFLVLKGVSDTVVAQGAGVAMGVASVVWGIIEKQANGNAIISAATNVVTFVGGILIAAGRASSSSVALWSGVVTSLVTVILNVFHIPIVATTVTSLSKKK